MCEKMCENCTKVRFIKPEEDNISFCVTNSEVSTIEHNVSRTFGLSTTHQESVEECDHPEEFVKKS